MKNLLRIFSLTALVCCCLTFSNAIYAQLDYTTAVGLRIGYFGNFGLTAKKAIGDNGALIEGILYADFDPGASTISVNGLYEQYYNINGVEGLNWYWAGGAYIGFLSFETGFAGDRESSTFLGLTGGVGLEYKFANVPIAISSDWLPGFNLTGGGGFSGRGGSLAVRYIID